MEFPFAERVALVTGASRGIGAALIRELASRGIGGMVLVARSKSELEELVEEIRLKHAPATDAPLVIIPTDLSDPETPARIKAETDRLGLKIGLLINNAGFGSYGLFHEMPSEKELAMVQVNIASLVALTRLYLPEMIERKAGAVINVSSTAAFQPVPYMSTYAATKAFVESFSEAIWGEMQEIGSPVKIISLCPGGTTTHFSDGLSARGRFEDIPHMTPEEVATVGLDALDSDEPYVVAGTLNYISTLAPRVLPRSVITRIAGNLFRPVKEGEDYTFAPVKISKEAIGMLSLATAAVAIGFAITKHYRK